MEKTYRIAIDEHCQKLCKLPQKFLIKIDEDTIRCNDGERVTIDTKDNMHEHMKVSFQLAYRSLDNWDHHFQLIDFMDEQATELKPLLMMTESDLTFWQKEFITLDPSILQFLHRASDFIDGYSEVSVIIALFALELQLDKIYDPLDKSGRIKQKRQPKCKEGQYDKICNLSDNGLMTDDESLTLVALNKLRNELAHTNWLEVKKACVQPCANGKQELMIDILKLESDFIEVSQGKFRLNHKASRRVLNCIIEAILKLAKVAD